MVSSQHIEESLSISYVNAIVAKSGNVLDIRSRDYGVDGSVIKILKMGNDFIDCGSAFDCQLKSTINWQLNNSERIINYDMKAEAYNRLVNRNNTATLPCLLLLLCLPRNSREWLTVEPEQLVLRKCCYYIFLNGSKTSNTSTIRIKIPEENIFDCKTIEQIIDNPFWMVEDA